MCHGHIAVDFNIHNCQPVLLISLLSLLYILFWLLWRGKDWLFPFAFQQVHSLRSWLCASLLLLSLRCYDMAVLIQHFSFLFFSFYLFLW